MLADVVLHTALRGYDRRAVDDFLLRCVASLGARAAEIPELEGLSPPDQPTAPLDAGDVRAARFAVVLRGYDVAQVDDVLARVAAALPAEDERPTWQEEPAPSPPDGESLALRKVVRGYDVAEVDAFLARCAHSLAGSDGRRIDAVPELASLLGRPRTGAPLRARDVEVVQFHVRGRGYDIEQVDGLLDRVAAALSGPAQ